jgi:hypothetical protein
LLTLQNAHALLIGIAAYKRIAPLPPSVLHDVEALAAALLDPTCGGYAASNVESLLNEAATLENLYRSFARLKERSNAESTVLIYVSAHGGRIEHGPYAGEYLLPVDVENDTLEQLAATAISGSDLSALLRGIPARRLVVIFDCCYGAGLAQAKGGGALKQGLSEELYATLAAGRGRVIMAAARANEPAYILPNARNSLFTQHLLAGLRGAAPAPGGVIRVLDLFSYLAPLVTAEQPRQHPVLKAELEENFALALAPAQGAVPVVPPDDQFAYDLFLSYHSQEPDRSWVRKVLRPALEAANLRVCIDHRDFRLGEPLVLARERAVTQSRYTLAILTPAYLTSGFAELENVLAQHLGLEEGGRRLLAVLREDCRPRLSLRAQLWLDMTDDNEFAENIARLAYELRQPA